MFDGLEGDELFWRLVRQYDPDLIGLHAPTGKDARELAPAVHERVMAEIQSSLARNGIEGAAVEDALRQAESEVFWHADLPDDLSQALVTWVSPLHHEGEPHSILVNGSESVPHELADVLKLRTLPARIENVCVSSDPKDQLVVTSSIGRLTPTTAHGLAERGVTMNQRTADSLGEAALYVWPSDRSSCPLALPEASLARRFSVAHVAPPLLVVGDDPRDWLLYHGLQMLRPFVYWLPASRSQDGLLFDKLLHELRWRASGDPFVKVLTAVSREAAKQTAAEILARARGRNALQSQLADWRDYVPHGAFWPADARSVRTTPLLRSGGTTEELPTPRPFDFSDEELLASGWLVDVDVREWRTFRHPALGPSVLPGPFSSGTDQRISAGGASYVGLSAFVQAGLGLENALSRRQLAPLPVLDALAEALSEEEWSVGLSDKGAYTQRSAEIFGGVEQLVGTLRNMDTRRLLDSYAGGAQSGSPGKFLVDTRRWYLSLEEATEVLGDAAKEVVNTLYDQGALIRGHVLKCEQCRATSFFSLTEHQRFTCRRCRHDQRATRAAWLGDPEPVFRYELAEVIYQFLDNDGDVPLLAAYDYFVSKLATQDRRPLDLGFEIEIFSPDGDKSEHDIVAVWGSDLWLGEATTQNSFGNDRDQLSRLRRLKQVADSLAARGVLFATTGEFSTRTHEHVRSVFTDWPRPDFAFVERLQTRPDGSGEQESAN